MNRKYNDKFLPGRISHANSFSSPYPPGGLIAWPDGSTSRLGQRRKVNSNNDKTIKKGCVQWFESPSTAVRA